MQIYKFQLIYYLNFVKTYIQRKTEREFKMDITKVID